MRKLALLVGLVAASAVVSSACVEKIDTDPPGGGSGGTAGSGGTGGTAPTYDGLFGSGSRLQAVYVDGGDGAERFAHFHDNELDQSCSFTESADGNLRCTPTHQTQILYTDAGCTDPIVVVRACDAAQTLPAHVSVQPEQECYDANVRRADAYTVGDASTPTNIYQVVDGGCVEDTSFDSTNDAAYEIAEADEALFAEGTISSVETDGGLGQRIATAADGAFQVLGAYNEARDENCAAMAIGDNLLCLSNNLAYGSSYSSTASCDEHDVAYATTGEACGEPQAVVKYTPAVDQCDPSTVTVHALGDAVAAESVYTDAGGTCEATTQTDYRYFEIGGEAADDILPTLVAATAGTGRLTLEQLTTPDGAVVGYQSAEFMDTEREEACWSQATSDGTKCLPQLELHPDTGTGYFSDDLCTAQILRVATSACDTGVPTYVGYQAAPNGTCASYDVESVHAVGAEHTGDVYIDVDGTCTLNPVAEVKFYEVGAAIPLTDFASLQEVTQVTE